MDGSRYEKIDPPEYVMRVGPQRDVLRALDTERGVEVMWIEYSNLPKRLLDRGDEIVRRLLALDHPNITRYLDGWTVEAEHRIVFIADMLSGSLASILSKKVELRPAVLRGWMEQVLLGLRYLHENGIVHRDLTCYNIWTTGKAGAVKIGGLEFSMFADYTNANELDVTPGYAAPECGSFDPPTPKVDIYSFGGSVLEMFTLQPPYAECYSVYQIFQRQMNRVKPAALARIKNPELLSLVESCLDWNPTARPSAAGLLEHPYLRDLEVAGPAALAAAGATAAAAVAVALAPSADGQEANASLKAYSGARAPGSLTASQPLSDPGGSRGGSGRVGEGGGREGAGASAAACDRGGGIGLSVKCYMPGHEAAASGIECIRVWLSEYRDSASLLQCVPELLKVPGGGSACVLKYLDDQEDYVTILPSTPWTEVCQFARSIHIVPRPQKYQEFTIG